MKYQNQEINPENIDLSDYNIKENKNFIFIFPKNNAVSKSQGIIYYRKDSKNYVVFGNMAHAHLLEVLFRKLKISKDTRFIDCVVGSFRPSSETFEWFKTEQVMFSPKKSFVVLKKVLSDDVKFKATKILERMLLEFRSRNKILVPKINLKKREESSRKTLKLKRKITFKRPI